MEDAKRGCLMLITLITILGTCTLLYQFRPDEPLFVVRMSKPVPTATPNVFHQVILEQARVDNQIKLAVVKHELRKQWALFVIPLATIGLGGYCLVTAWRKWLSS